MVTFTLFSAENAVSFSWLGNSQNLCPVADDLPGRDKMFNSLLSLKFWWLPPVEGLFLRCPTPVSTGWKIRCQKNLKWRKTYLQTFLGGWAEIISGQSFLELGEKIPGLLKNLEPAPSGHKLWEFPHRPKSCKVWEYFLCRIAYALLYLGLIRKLICFIKPLMKKYIHCPQL